MQKHARNEISVPNFMPLLRVGFCKTKNELAGIEFIYHLPTNLPSFQVPSSVVLVALMYCFPNPLALASKNSPV